MNKLSMFCILGLAIILIDAPPIRAQATPKVPAYSRAPADSASPPSSTNTYAAPASAPAPGQAPDDVIKKLSDLVHAGKYADAQQSVTALLMFYPDDQRLVKAKVLLDKAMASSKPEDLGASANPPADSPASAASNGTVEPLSGMDKVDYEALKELVRQAQQTTDLAQQTQLLKQFMEQSGPFLQKHPNNLMMWELRAASAMGLNAPLAGYESGQKLLALGAADNNDPNVQHLLAQLKNSGWLDEKKAELKEQQKQFAWLLGTWNVNWVWWWGEVNARDREQFVATDSGIEGYLIGADGVRNAEPDFRVSILDSGEVKWEVFDPPADCGQFYVFRHVRGNALPKVTIGRRADPGSYFATGTHHFGWFPYSTETGSQPFYPSGWQPVVSSAFDKYKHSITLAVAPQNADTSPNKFFDKNPVRLTFSKVGGAADDQTPPQ